MSEVVVVEWVDGNNTDCIGGDGRQARWAGASTLARRAELVAEYRRSKLTMAAFARREGLAYSTFAGWVWKSQCLARLVAFDPVNPRKSRSRFHLR